MGGLLRVAGGGVAILLFLIGRGARMTGARLASAPDYYLGTAFEILAAVLALIVFVLYHKTRLGGPAPSRRWTSPVAVGWSFVVYAVILLVSAASMFILAAHDSGVAGTIMQGYLDYLGTPDVALKTVSALLVAGSGAAAVAQSSNAAVVVRLAAVPMVLVWPHGTTLAAWGAWSTLGADWQTRGTGSRSAARKAAVMIAAVLVMLVVGMCSRDRLLSNLFHDTVSDSAENPSNVALLAAVNNSDLASVTDALARGADPNCTAMGNPAIYLAANRGRDDIIEALLSNGASINAKTAIAGRSALHEAALRGHIGTVRLLLAHGADVNATNSNGRTPLYYVTTPPSPLTPPANHEAIATVLREHGGR